MEDVKSVLLALKEKAIVATKNADTDFYEDYLADNAVAIVPMGVFNKKAIVNQIGAVNSQFKSSRVEDTKVIVLTPESGIVTYKATFKQDNNSEFELFVTTVYAKINEEWKGVFYQQTPIVTSML